MKRLALLMSRHAITWYPWMILGTLIVIPMFLAHVVADTFRHWYGMWHWEWKSELGAFFSGFSEARRKGVRSLGSKPQAGGVRWVNPPPSMMQ